MSKARSVHHPGAAVPHEPLDLRQLAAVARLFNALSEPTRLRLLQELRAGPAAVGELVERTGFKQANVSKQLGVLLTAGVVDRQVEGTRAAYSIGLPLVSDLCDLVCAGLADRAAETATALTRRRVRA